MPSREPRWCARSATEAVGSGDRETRMRSKKDRLGSVERVGRFGRAWCRGRGPLLEIEDEGRRAGWFSPSRKRPGSRTHPTEHLVSAGVAQEEYPRGYARCQGRLGWTRVDADGDRTRHRKAGPGVPLDSTSGLMTARPGVSAKSCALALSMSRHHIGILYRTGGGSRDAHAPNVTAGLASPRRRAFAPARSSIAQHGPP